MSVGRISKIIPSGGKRLVQTLIFEAKKMWMSSNLAKSKREEEELTHWQDEWKGKLDKGEVAPTASFLLAQYRMVRILSVK